MPLPLFLPCAAGVEELLADEITRVLPGTRLHVSRGGVALEGNPREVMLLNLELRPRRVRDAVGEEGELSVRGYARRRSLGDLSRSRGDCVWALARRQDC